MRSKIFLHMYFYMYKYREYHMVRKIMVGGRKHHVGHFLGNLVREGVL